MGCSRVPSLLVLFLKMCVTNDILVSRFFSLQVPKTIYKIKSKPLITKIVLLLHVREDLDM
jgi:hypothetical protein